MVEGVLGRDFLPYLNRIAPDKRHYRNVAFCLK